MVELRPPAARRLPRSLFSRFIRSDGSGTADRAPRLGHVRQAGRWPLALGREVGGPEHLVPDRRGGAEVLVEMSRLQGVVDAVGAVVHHQPVQQAKVQPQGRVREMAHHQRERRQDFRLGAGVDVEDDRQRQSDEDRADQVFGPVVIAVDGAQIGYGVVRAVQPPQERRMLQPVEPVVDQIEEQQPDQRRHDPGDRLQGRGLEPLQHGKADQRGQVQRLSHPRKSHVGDRAEQDEHRPDGQRPGLGAERRFLRHRQQTLQREQDRKDPGHRHGADQRHRQNAHHAGYPLAPG
jgi:hypothetical protein